jgi:hypothetical protein
LVKIRPGKSAESNVPGLKAARFVTVVPEQLQWRLEDGSRLLVEAGFPAPQTFVAPHDRLSRGGAIEVARRSQADITVVSFDDVAARNGPLN